MKVFVMYAANGEIRGAAISSLVGAGVQSPAGHQIHSFEREEITDQREQTRFLYDLVRHHVVTGSPPALTKVEGS